MNDIFVNSNDIEQVSKELQLIGENLTLQLSLITQYIKHIFSKIKDCKAIEEAATYFSLLDRMQSILTELVYKHEIGIPERLRRFVNDFDNLEQDATYYFDKIKIGKYTY